MFLFTYNDTKNVLNESGFSIEKELCQLITDTEFSKIIKKSLDNIEETFLPKKIETKDFNDIIDVLNLEAGNVIKYADLNKTFGILLRQNLFKKNYQFSDSDISKIEDQIWKVILDDDLKKSLKDILQKIQYTNLSLFNKLIGKIDAKIDVGSSTDEPPFSIRSLLELAWGLSLSFSHEKSQKSLGDKFYDSLNSILRRYVMEKLNQDKSLSDPQLKHEKFVTNLLMSLTKTSRNLGFVRDKHTRFIDEKAKEIERGKKLREELSGFVPTSKESLLAQITAFLGGGSISSIVAPFVTKTTYPADKIPRFEKLLEMAPDGNKTDVFTKLYDEVMSRQGEITFQPTLDEIGIFVIAGSTTLGIMVVASKILGNILTTRSRNKMQQEQQNYWSSNFMPEAAEHIYYYYKDIESLLKNYYGEKVKKKNEDEFLNEINYSSHGEEFKMPDHITEDKDKKIFRFILYTILPHYHKYDIPNRDEKIITVKSDTYWRFMKAKKFDTSNDFLKKFLPKE